jgi:hypothetical protein
MSVYPDDYRKLVNDAHDSLDRLLDGSPHFSWPNLRRGYGELLLALLEDDEKRVDLQVQHLEHQAARRAARKAWNALCRERRETLILQLLGEHRLSRIEISSRVSDWLGACVVSDESLRRLFNDLVKNREVDRVRARGRVYYSRRRDLNLTGPIAELEHALHSEAVE